MNEARPDEGERASALQLAITTEALSVVAGIDALSTGFALIAASALAAGTVMRVAASVATLELTACLALGLAAKWVALRVRFDRGLFAMLAEDARRGALETAAFDDAMVGLRLVAASKAGRDWSSRCRGALALVRKLGWLVGLQALSLIVAAASGLGL
jgi:hypothetical protein